MSTAHSSHSRPPAAASLAMAVPAGGPRLFDGPGRRSQRDLVIASLLRCPGARDAERGSRLPL
jgi:hypothetical protein